MVSLFEMGSKEQRMFMDFARRFGAALRNEQLH